MQVLHRQTDIEPVCVPGTSFLYCLEGLRTRRYDLNVTFQRYDNHASWDSAPPIADTSTRAALWIRECLSRGARRSPRPRHPAPFVDARGEPGWSDSSLTSLLTVHTIPSPFTFREDHPLLACMLSLPHAVFVAGSALYSDKGAELDVPDVGIVPGFRSWKGGPGRG